MEEDEGERISDNGFTKEDDRSLSDPKINEENKQIREKKCIVYDEQIKIFNTISGH